MKKGIGKGILIAVIVIASAFVAALIYTLTDGFKSDVKKFMLIEDGGKYILSDESGATIYDSATLEVHHYDGDADISAKIVPVKVSEDYRFTVSGYEYSWNNDVVRAKADFTKYFSVRIDQTKNTVTVSGRLQKALTAYAEALGGTLDSMQGVPPSDMFNLEVSSGGSAIRYGFNILVKIEKITFSENGLKFE